MHNIFLEKINEYSTITIFRHVNPDFDALGSQFGLQTWLKDNYPDKNVYCLGTDEMRNDFHPHSDVVEDSIVKESFAIILDCSDTDRIDDKRFMLAKESFRIDHHPNGNCNSTFEIVKTDYASTSELLVELFKYSNKDFSSEAANYLYRGIIADTLSFKTNNTSSKTLELASYVVSKGVNIAQANLDVFDISKDGYLIANHIRNNANYDIDGLAYIIVNKLERDKLGLSSRQVKDFVAEFHGVKEFKIWAIFAENDEGIYEGSLRSKNATINDIANKYHGGGHKNACGVKNLTLYEVHALLKELQERID